MHSPPLFSAFAFFATADNHLIRTPCNLWPRAGGGAALPVMRAVSLGQR
jgi:hypothetical protein